MFSAYSYFSYNLYSASVIISNEKNILRTCCNWTPVLCSKSWKLTLQHECVLGYYIMKITTLLIIVLQAESSGVKFPESKGAGVYLRSSRVRKYFLQCLSPYLEEWRGTGAGGGGWGTTPDFGIVGSLSNNDSNDYKNITSKVNLLCFKLYLTYSISFNSANNGERYPCEVTSEERAQKFHNEDVSLPWSG